MNPSGKIGISLLILKDKQMRYDRQIILPEVGEEGQKKLQEAKVLIVGVGGLGSPIALYLAGGMPGTGR